MNNMAKSSARFSAVFVLATAVAACGLPRAGPDRDELLASDFQQGGDTHIVAVDQRVNSAAAEIAGSGFTEAFRNVPTKGPDTINRGDVLGLVIYENVTEGLFAGSEGGPGSLEQVQVDDDGFIFIPYAGRIRAADRTPEQLRQIITEQLDAQTPDPQVLVKRVAGDGATVSVSGDVMGQGVFPIERPTLRLTAMLAEAGGASVPTEAAQISITRDGRRESIWLTDLYENPSFDIALRDQDRIIVEEDRRSFTVMGSTGRQNRVPFETPTISAMEALSLVGGLSTNVADPTGVFVLREEPAHIANKVLQRDDITGPRRFVYVIDLTEPGGMFNARDFEIRDEDTVYVTEAPFVSWQKRISALTGSLGTASDVQSVIPD